MWCKCGDVLCATRQRKVCNVWLEAVEGELCLLEELEVMRRMLLCILEAVEGGLCLLEVPEVIRCVFSVF